MATITALYYPIALDPVESGLANIIQRIREGLPVYTQPSLSYVPSVYMPFYFYISALIPASFGSFFGPRLISLLAAIGCCTVIFLWLRKEKLPPFLAFSGVGLFCALWRLSEFWYHLVNVNCLLCFLLLFGLYLLHHYRSLLTAVSAGIILSLAFFTNQTALIAISPVIFVLFSMIPRKRWLCFASVFLCMSASGVFAFNHFSSGWFWCFVFEIPKYNKFYEDQWANIIILMFSETWPVLIITLIGLLGIIKRNDWAKVSVYSALLGGFILCAYLMRLRIGTGPNTYILAYTILSLCSPLALICIYQKTYIGRNTYNVSLLLLAAQLILLRYDTYSYMPTVDNSLSAKKYREYLENIGGDILIERNIFDPKNNKIKFFDISTALADIQPSNNQKLTDQLNNEIVVAVKERRFSAIITRKETPGYDIMKYYHIKEDVSKRLNLFLRTTEFGLYSYPSIVWVKNSP